MKHYFLIIFMLASVFYLKTSYAELAEFESIEEYMECSATLMAFDESIVKDLNPSYDVIDGVLFHDHILMRYPALKTVDLYSIPEGTLSIDINAFAHVKPGTITTIELPASCVDLGYPIGSEWWLEYMGGVTDIIVDPQNPNFSSIEGLLLSKDGNTLLFYPRGRSDKVFIIPEGVQYIGNGACMACNFEQVVFPESLQQIGDYAFCQNQLRNITFNDRLSYIGVGAFEESEYLESITIPGGVKKVDYSAFSQCFSLCEVIIEEGLLEIADYAFWASPILYMSLPSTLIRIGEDIVSSQDEIENDCIYYVHEASYALEWVKNQGGTFRIADE